MNEPLYLIDTIAPFKVHDTDRPVNWSKTSFSSLERDGLPRSSRLKKSRHTYRSYIRKVSALGCNAISVDELSRLALFPFYSDVLFLKIQTYQRYFRKLFMYAGKRGMRVFVTTDVMFSHREIDHAVGNDPEERLNLLARACRYIFEAIPCVDGFILRIGESDGVHSDKEFYSSLMIKTPREANRLLKRLLPIFEFYDKTLVFRTWTLGAYPIGDLMWNESTYDAVFEGIASDNLVVSMKYGAGDFFRGMPLTPLAERGPQKKLFEFQARREYEGFGRFPMFVGYEYERYRDAIIDLPGYTGISVWAQTGGWSRFRNFTFVGENAYWNELNTAVTISLFKDRSSADDAVLKWYQGRKRKKFLTFLKLSDRVIAEGLYDPAFSGHDRWFNRVRVPPLMHVFWDSITVTGHLAAIHRLVVKDGRSSIEASRRALDDIDRMKVLADDCGFPCDHQFHKETFILLSLARDAIHSSDFEESLASLADYYRRYHERYPDGYRLHISRYGFRHIRLYIRLFGILLRRGRRYRTLDRLLFNRLTFPIYRLVFMLIRKGFPDFIGKQGMPFETVVS